MGDRKLGPSVPLQLLLISWNSATDRIQVSPVVIFYFHPAVAVYDREFCWITRIRVIWGMIIAIMKTLNCDGGSSDSSGESSMHRFLLIGFWRYAKAEASLSISYQKWAELAIHSWQFGKWQDIQPQNMYPPSNRSCIWHDRKWVFEL